MFLVVKYQVDSLVHSNVDTAAFQTCTLPTNWNGRTENEIDYHSMSRNARVPNWPPQSFARKMIPESRQALV